MARLNSLFDGSLAEYEFHMAGNNPKVDVGDFVYTIFNHQLEGRLRIKELIPGHVNPNLDKPEPKRYVTCHNAIKCVKLEWYSPSLGFLSYAVNTAQYSGQNQRQP